MFAKLMLRLENPIDALEKSHPMLFMITFQILTAIAMIIAVGGIALTGGMVIWLFYRFMGVL